MICPLKEDLCIVCSSSSLETVLLIQYGHRSTVVGGKNIGPTNSRTRKANAQIQKKKNIYEEQTLSQLTFKTGNFQFILY